MFSIKFFSISWFILLFKFAAAAPLNSHATAKVTLLFDAQYVGDTVLCSYCPALYNADIYKLQDDTITSTIDKDGRVSFTLSDLGPDGYAYVTISRDYYEFIPQFQALFKDCLIKAGDDIYVTVTSPFPIPAKGVDLREFNKRQYQIFFTGKGASKFSMCYASFQPYRFPKEFTTTPLFSENGNFNDNSSYVTIGKKWIKRFDIFQREMDSLSFQIIKADIVGRCIANIGNAISTSAVDSIHLRQAESQILNILETFDKNISSRAKKVSKDFATGAFEIEYCRKRKYDSVLAASIIAHYQGILRDKVLLFYLSSFRNQDPPALTTKLLSKLSNQTYKSRLGTNLHRAPGKKAFDFKLISSTGDSVSLSSLAGKVVLIDFFFKGCLGCADYYQNVLKEVEHEFKDSAVAFVSISTDETSAAWVASLKSGLYTSTDLPNVINLSLKGDGMHHPMISYYNIVGVPTTILIDKEGRIIAYQDPQLRNKERLRDLLVSNLQRN